MLLAFNKPHGVLCQFTPGATPVAGRKTLADYIRQPEVYPAGRLDTDSEGLLLLTDEAGRGSVQSLSYRLTDPAQAHPRSYLVQVEGAPDDAALRKLAHGILLDAKMTRPAQVRRAGIPDWLWPREPPVRVRKTVPDSWISLVLTEGRNRQVRRMTAAVGHPTLRLIRVKIGAFPLGDLPPGQSRTLTESERRAALSR